MKRSALKELIKRSMREVTPNTGAMTPEEEKMVADYEEEEANKHALDSERPMEESELSPALVKDKYKEFEREGGNVVNRLATHFNTSPEYIEKTLHHLEKVKSTYGDFLGNKSDYFADEREHDVIREASSKSAEILNRPAGHMTFEQMGMIIMLADAAGENRGADEFLSKVSSKKEADRYIESLISKVDGDEGVLAEAEKIVAAWAEKKTLKEADLSQANFSDLNQVVRNIAHVNEVGMEEAAMQAIEYIAEQFDVPVDFKDF
jgi:hypothetical protein